MASNSHFLAAITKLVGRENFLTWQFAVKAYMEHEGLWQCIEAPVDKAETDAEKLVKAKSKLILLIDPVNFVHIQNCQDAKQIWNTLKVTFSDSGLTRRVGLIRKLISTRLVDCGMMEEYVQILMNTSHKLREINCAVGDEWLATFMLAGLPDTYQPMIMALESSGTQLTADYVKTKLLQDAKPSGDCSDSSKAFYLAKAKYQSRNKKGPEHTEPSSSENQPKRIQCFSCHKYGHKSFHCPDKATNEMSTQNINNTKKGAFVVSSEVLSNNEWFLDSATSFHMSPRSDWMDNHSAKPIEHIVAANNAKLEVKSAGVVQVKVEMDGVDNELSISNVLHVPDLSSNLLSVSQLCQKGHTVVFKNEGCQIYDHHMDIVATGRHINNMFLLNTSNNRCFLVDKKNESLLWHCRLGHLNHKDLCKLRSRANGNELPQLNELAERMWWTLVKNARCILFGANSDKSFWTEAISTAAYVTNRSSNRNLEMQTPKAIWTGKVPNLNHLKVFGCRAMVYMPKKLRKKLDAKSEEFIFVGYCEETKGFRLIHPLIKKFIESRDVVFLESEVIEAKMNLPVSVTDKTEQVMVSFDDPSKETFVADQFVSTWNHSVDNEMNDANDTDVVNGGSNSDQDSAPLVDIMPRRLECQPKPKFWPDLITRSVRAIVYGEPQTVEEALSCEDSHLWKRAMLDEFNSLLVNDTWELVDLPEDRKAIPCKWVFKIKRDGEGAVERYKARLVIEGFAQREGIDYEETFSPVVRYNSLRYLMSLAAEFDLDIEQLDAVSAFLQGDIDEQIFMIQPKEFARNSKVCRLNKAIYGLKQASCQWNIKLDSTLKKIGFYQSSMDPCVYFQIHGHKRTYIAIYIDDFMVFSNDIEMKQFLEDALFRRFRTNWFMWSMYRLM